MKHQRLTKHHSMLCLLLICFRATAAPSSENANTAFSEDAFENGLRPAVDIVGQPVLRWNIHERMAHYRVPAVGLAVIRDGQIVFARTYGITKAGTDETANTETLFSVGSLSKLPAAVTSLRLVQEGRLALDEDVNEYLTRWRIPDSGFDVLRPVTMRGILSHTAGLTVSGFPDFKRGDPLPSVIDTLNGHPPAKNGPVMVFRKPGEAYQYSGGGTTIQQLVIEEISGLEFPAAARKLVLAPLGMERSTYVNPLPADVRNVARAHGSDGRPNGWEVMPETAASGLWTTPTDYAKFVIALINAYREDDNTFLDHNIVQSMMTEVGPSSYGLGPRLAGSGFQRHFFHRGSNDSYKAWMEGHLVSGGGAVIFTNGAAGLDLRFEIRRALADVEDWPVELATAVPPVEIASETFADYAGLYEIRPAHSVSERRMNPGVTHRLFVEDNHLFLGEPGSPGVHRLIPESQSHFISEKDNELRVEIVHGYDGDVTGIILRSGLYQHDAVRTTL